MLGNRSDSCIRVRNAIRVENIGRTQVGHIPRNIAAKLAPLMDRGEVTVEGVMLEGNRKSLLALNFAGTQKIRRPRSERRQV